MKRFKIWSLIATFCLACFSCTRSENYYDAAKTEAQTQDIFQDNEVDKKRFIIRDKDGNVFLVNFSYSSNGFVKVGKKILLFDGTKPPENETR